MKTSPFAREGKTLYELHSQQHSFITLYLIVRNRYGKATQLINNTR